MAKVEFADGNNGTAAGSEKDDVASFTQRFCQTTALVHKKDLVSDLLSRRPGIKYAKIIDSLPGLTDQKRCIEYIAAYKGKLSLLENLSLSRRLANLNRRLEKQAGAVYAKIIDKNRRGRTFDEIIMGNITPLIRENETSVLDLVLRKIGKLKQAEAASRIYASFIADLISAVHIINTIKDNGITAQSIEEVLVRSGSSLLKAGMRTVLQNVFFMDPQFALYKQKIQELLREMRRQELDKEAKSAAGRVEEVSLADLFRVKDLEEFLDKASVIVERDQKYVKEVARLFDLHLNKPLLGIYKLLKFPLDREAFRNWMRKAPMPAGLLPEIETEIEEIKAGFEKDAEGVTPPAGYEELLGLIYDYKICFTDKYKLVATVMKNHAEKKPLAFCLDQIKNIQYKIENRFLTVVLGQLESCFSFSEAQKLLLADRKKIRERIEGYKVKLKKNIDSLLQGQGGRLYAVLPSVLKYTAQEKIISRDAFLQIDQKVNPEHRLGFIVRLANSLIGFYFLLNCGLILDLLKKYFNSLKASDGVFLRHKLSTMTREEIYELCAHYTHEKPVVVQNLEKYLNWGRAEKEVRTHVLARLGVPHGFAPEVKAGKYRLTGAKYDSGMALRIFDTENKVRFAKKVSGVNTFLDFLNIIKQNKIDNLIRFDDNSIKAFYQNIHLQAVAELSVYIEERLRLLTLPDSLFRLTSQEIRAAYAKSESPEEYVNKLAASGEQERALRNTLLGKLDLELKTTPTGEEEIVRRVKLEIQNQQAALEHLGAMLDFVRNLPHTQMRSGSAEPVSADEVKKYLRMHRMADNTLYLEKLEQRQDTFPGREAIGRFLAALPKPEVFVTGDSVYEGRYESPDQAKQAVGDSLLLRSVEDNLESLRRIFAAGKNELTARSAYINKHNRYTKGSPGHLLYAREMEEQHALSKTISRFLDFISHEISALEQVKQLNDAAEERFAAISGQMRDQDPHGQARTFVSRLQELTDPREKLDIAAKFLVTSQADDVIQSSEQVINGGSVNRYKILLALYNVLDQQQDYEVKLKILEEFCEYLEKNRPEVYLRLKSLLDTQRDNLCNRYRSRRAKISDLWRVLEAVSKPEDKLKHLSELMADEQWSTFYSYIDHIKQGLLAENVEQLLERNKNLPLEDQQDLLEKTRLFRSEEYNTPEINEKISRKLLEINARRGILTDAKKRVFSSRNYSYLMRIPANREKAVKSINTTLFKEARSAVEKEFKAQGIPEHEVKRYLSANMGNVRDLSTFGVPDRVACPDTLHGMARPGARRPGEKTEARTSGDTDAWVRAAGQTETMEAPGEDTAARGRAVKQQLIDEASGKKQPASDEVKTDKTKRSSLLSAVKRKEARPVSAGGPERQEVQDNGAEAGLPNAPAGRLKKAGKRNGHPGPPEMEIRDLNAAGEVFGPAREGEERELVAVIQKAAYDRKNKEAMEKIQNQVIWENGKSGDVDKMSRVLFALQANPVIRENEELSDFLDKQMHTLSSVIISQAQKTLDNNPEKQSALAAKGVGESSPRRPAPETETGHNTGQGTAEREPAAVFESPMKGSAENRTTEGLQALITALEELDEFTDLHEFAGKRGFEEHEEIRLERIMGELGERGSFIFLTKEGMLLGRGRLKPLIHKAFDEYTSGKHVSVNPQLLKKAWDFVKTKGDPQAQLRLIGASSRDERGDLFKELERMLGQGTTPVLKLSKQKLFSQKPQETQAPGTAERAYMRHDPGKAPDADKAAHERKQAEVRGTPVSHPKRRRPARPKVTPGPKSKPAVRPKKTDYKLTTQKYIAKSYAPVITDYLRRMYKHKMDFFIPLGEKRQFYTQEVLRRSIEGILRKDARGRSHTDLLHSLKQDERLFALILQELFIQFKSRQGQVYYFPKFLRGEIEIK